MFNRKYLYVVIIFVVIGFALRIYGSLGSEFFRDEAFSALVAQKDFGGIINTITTDSSVPFSYFILHTFGSIFGYTTFSMRLPSLIASTIGFYYFWKFTNLLNIKKSTQNFLLIIFLISPPLIYYSYEARFYGFFITVFIYQLYLLTSIWQKKLITKADQVKFIISSLIGVYNHTLYWIVLFVWGISALVFIKKYFKTHGRKVVFQALIPFVFIGILFLPWVSILIKQFNGGGNGSWLFFDIFNSLFITLLEFAYWPAWLNLKQIDSVTIYTCLSGTFALILLIVGIVKCITNKSFKNMKGYAFIFLSLIIIFFLISFKTPVFYVRYLSFLIPLFLLLISVSLDSLNKNQKYIFMSAYIILNICVYTVLVLPNINSNITVTKILTQIKSDQPSNYLIINKDALTYFNMEFYGGDRYKSYIYDPNLATPIWVGKSVIPADRFIRSIPDDKAKIYIITDSGLAQDISTDLASKGYTQKSELSYINHLQMFVFEK